MADTEFCKAVDNKCKQGVIWRDKNVKLQYNSP